MVETNLPIIFLKDVIVLPYNEIRIEFKNDKDKAILNTAEMYHDNHVLLVNIKDPLEENPNIKDLPKLALLGTIKTKIELPNGLVRVVIVCIDRVEVLNYLENEHELLEAFVIPTKAYDYDEREAIALKRILLRDLESFVENSPYMSNSVLGKISEVNSLSKLSDIVVSELPLDYFTKFKYIVTTNPMLRVKMIIEDLNKEIETIQIENDLETRLKQNIDNEQKEYLLREKIKIIKEELGDVDLKEKDVNELRKKLSSLDLPIKVQERLNEEINRYELIPQTSPEISMSRNYIDWLIKLPWSTSTKDNYDISKIEKELNKTHFGLNKVKDRILEYIMVKKKTNDLNTPIICLLGPPGTGKTTLAKSIAKALNKKFVKISVGGVHDEAEIMGHRRTYIGANPGKIIQGLKKVGTNNPVFLIDEIDKLTKDYKGDPASSLLDILDKEQNNIFVDNYIEEEFDLSKVMFILTANNINTIPEALRDRLEIIELSSYTVYEKKEIVNNYLLPKILKEYNLKKEKIVFTEEAILKLIRGYTKEAGARELERKVASIIRKIIIDIEKTKNKEYLINEEAIEKYLGKEEYILLENEKNKTIGVVNALAYTIYGGEILKVSSTTYKGEGKITLTGTLGDVMKESAYIALSYIKSNYEYFGIDYKYFIGNDIHIHFESGATPKDGPSAGVTLVTSIISLLTKKVIPNTISMTGEITLRGTVLPIGGLKEKLIAATVNNIKKVYIPLSNESDLEDIPDNIKNKLEIILVKDYKDIYKNIFNKKNT